mgnify:FL=1
MDKTAKIVLHFSVPMELTMAEGTVINETLVPKLIATAKQMLLQRSYDPRIEIIYDSVSKDEVRQDEVPGVQDGQSEVHNDVGTPGREDTDSDKGLQRDEPGPVERNDPSTTGYSRDGSEDRKEEKRGVHVDETV